MIQPSVYPRWRGELPVSLLSLGVGRGLSPLARGTQLPDGVFVAFARFIPAGAGNSGPMRGTLSIMSVYPRWRGELAGILPTDPAPPGLSPLARGTPFTYRVTSISARFIPAGAGNSSSMRISSARATVYPRWRGELYFDENERNPWAGLSPLARGTHSRCIPSSPFQRFIPAGAGNSEATGVVLTVMSVYPRWRGELVGPAVTIYLICGLSPLARGTRDREYMAWDMARFIPAGAGNSESTHRRSCTSAVYPRWRGELAC